MSIHVGLYHKTSYRFDRAVEIFPHVLRLRPAPHTRIPILSYALRIAPEKHFINWQQDPYSNYQARLVFPEKSSELTIEVDLVAELRTINPFDFFLEESAHEYPFTYEPWLKDELLPYLVPLEAGPLLSSYIKRTDLSRKPTIDFVVNLNRLLHNEIKYVIRMEPGVQTPEETLELKKGSCRDSAWLLVQLLRNIGLAARFVSGYLIQLTPDVKSLDGPSGSAVDFTDLHAWTEVYLPGAGWIGLDPTSGLLAAEGHIPLACTAQPATAAPVVGATGKCEVKFDFEMKVARLKEIPRVTKPYTDESWNEILQFGEKLDREIVAQDLRLTMGGEPTFVSIDDRDGAAWNTDALGGSKRELAGDLLRRLRDRFAPHGLLHFGQGKWYPGEVLPRWNLQCFWRKDGEPCWLNPELFADERRDYGLSDSDAQRFIRALAIQLGVTPDYIMPGYEDVWYYLWCERRLPTNLDPLNNKLSDRTERERLARIFDRGLERIIGYALPLRRNFTGSSTVWESGPWFLRREHLFLIPGDSPMGFRLPLDSIPWAAPTELAEIYTSDPWLVSSSLPTFNSMRTGRNPPILVQRPELRERYHGPPTGSVRTRFPNKTGTNFPVDPYKLDPATTPQSNQSSPWIVRQSLCIEPRDGRLYIFLPPLASLEYFLELTAAIEATAESLKVPVLLEGYPPPFDLRLNRLGVTPDPGVLEVNIHPSSNWAEMIEITTGLYEEAHHARLASDKFMMDGRHTGTGGGNHIVVGSSIPADSPFLRRPHLIKSLIGYWNNHPSLSFLFSGLFVGPTSQAPRIDEARNDSVREMEMAFAEIDRLVTNEGSYSPPWLLDRILRDLLIDASGNTHRTEFCIDKLYSPDHAGGRLGLIEFRAFEMPPHARMSLTQQLLLRAIITRFWREPYARKLVRWGTELHDRFMLPHFVKQDFGDVLDDLKAAGFPLQPQWFAPHFEFRFPSYGEIRYRDLRLNIRGAIEPWHVLGEDPGGGGTVRYVDSSVERLEAKLEGMTDGRHFLLCNGRRVPLQATGVNGEFVAGIRYRAWQPSRCLHPTIPPDAPLVFDLYDLWSARTVAGCTYHVGHPGGRNHERLPVNAYEAEGRRLSRFWEHGHTPNASLPQDEQRDPEFPLTLDLRTGPRSANIEV